MSPEFKYVEDQDDEVVVVTLSRKDYLIIKEMIEERRSLKWFGKWIRNFLFIAAGGLLSLIALGDWAKHILRVFNG